MKKLFLAFLAVPCYALWQKWELAKFRVTKYEVASVKIKNPVNVAVVADLHGFTYGKGNKRLLRQVGRIKPQAIFVPGDMLVSKYSDTFASALKTLQGLVKIAPVYYSYGNHESRLREPGRINHALFMEYLENVKKAGVTVMETESQEIFLSQNKVQLSALELELDYYEKGRIVPLKKDYLKERLPRQKEGAFQILLAHNPAYAREYLRWGADVAFCGHNHGGLIRIPGIGSLISPQLTWFPKYDAGRFQEGDKNVIISKGLGTHTFHVRIFNRAELLWVKLLPAQKTQGNR